jgi:hypothetical protein
VGVVKRRILQGCVTADTRPAATFDLDDSINRIVIDRAVKVARKRPPPWSTRHDHIPWSRLTDSSDNARLLPAKSSPTVAAIGTRRPPLAAVVALCARPPGQPQRLCARLTALFPAFAQDLTHGFNYATTSSATARGWAAVSST